MFRFAVLCLCASATWALPSSPAHSKVLPSKVPGARIINGNQAAEGQFPWQVALFLSSSESTWFCGGSIISEEWILTSGNCINGADSATIVSGSTDAYGGDVSDSSRLILHEDYDNDLLANNIGLIRLRTPLNLGGNTIAVSLSSEELGENVGITVSGWGLTSDDGTTISDSLNYVELVTISNTECKNYYGSILPEMVCADSPSSQVRSTCTGDSGGPVVINAGSNPVHVAIASFVSTEGCESGAPSGYTRTAVYRDWIQNHTGL
ncbi:brachyurin-like [Zophobas morio]|uniref:brachyurin-like n=1 Tax=Zophobas morio TaxID=2755281 RepID=UPI0030832B63